MNRPAPTPLAPPADPAAVTRLEVPSPIGPLRLDAAGDALVALRFEDDAAPPAGSAAETSTPAAGLLKEAAGQLRDYFAGRRRRFDLPLAPHGTAFERKVWDAVAGVAFGRTATYGRIAARLGDPRAVRAVGRANGANPLPILIPCHRIVGAHGRLTGYAGGLDRKALLLGAERDAAGLFGESSSDHRDG
jgi:methylated-DNA-[protein]-cysteine S-methyltransferase